MKCYLQNHCGTVFRADKIKWLKERLPKPTDISRRLLLCQQNNIKFVPYHLGLSKEDYSSLKLYLGDRGSYGAREYFLFTNDNIVICKIFEYEHGPGADNSAEIAGSK